MLQVSPTLAIPDSEIELSFIRSPGPGGQNVNKTESAVQLRFNARASASLSNAVYMRLKALAGRRLNHDGVFVITANRFRSQQQNRDDALARLADLIAKAEVAPKRRRATKPTRSAKRKRLEGKRRRSDLKKDRGRVSGE